MKGEEMTPKREGKSEKEDGGGLGGRGGEGKAGKRQGEARARGPTRGRESQGRAGAQAKREAGAHTHR